MVTTLNEEQIVVGHQVHLPLRCTFRGRDATDCFYITSSYPKIQDENDINFVIEVDPALLDYGKKNSNFQTKRQGPGNPEN